jgi:hypothetical protein
MSDVGEVESLGSSCMAWVMGVGSRGRRSQTFVAMNLFSRNLVIRGTCE